MTGGAASLALDAGQVDLVVGILRAHLPAGTRAWVFGSRASGRSKPFSDLDLAVDAGRPLDLDELAVLAEALSESDLPWKVDVVDFQGVDGRFQAVIRAGMVPLPGFRG